MGSRIVMALLVLGVAAAGFTWAGQVDETRQPPAKGADVAKLERRLVEMEKRIAELVAQLQHLQKEQKPPAPLPDAKIEIKIYTLKHADAATLVAILQTLLEGQESRNLRLANDTRTNSIVARGPRHVLDLIEAVLVRLDEPVQPRREGEPDKKSSKANPALLPELKARLAVAESDVAMYQERVAWTERMTKLGYTSTTQVQNEKSRLLQAQVRLETARRLLQEAAAGAKPGSDKK